MIDILQIQNFKCFSHIEIPLNGLTVFAGANGNGKSTAIQAMLLLRRTIENIVIWVDGEFEFIKNKGIKIGLNGAYELALGNSSNLNNKSSDDPLIKLGIKGIRDEFHVHYLLKSNELMLRPEVIEGDNIHTTFSIFYREFYYLNAERIGPRIRQSVQFYEYPNTGPKGEFVAQLLGDTEFSYSFKVDEKRKFNHVQTPRLEQQVNAWLGYLMAGVTIKANYDIDTGSAQITVENIYTKGEQVNATNIGFGISYVLPIIVTGLIAKKGSYMIIENPEAHLHPSAQSRIGRFLSVIAQSGVRVIIETHSDHIINGIQVASVSKEINPELININFFDQNPSYIQPELKTIKFNQTGELSHWPSGFFDQTQVDFAQLHKLRKK
ncbi:MAG: DUF3696 domain-containing protein [Bacteroidetes bacterium]|nr:DUF3696 domain-containing protein [Bacteroidota bacterium]